MDNPVLLYFKSMIGQSMGKGPSPLAKWLDGTLLAAEEGSLQAAYTVREEMCNPGRILHGGIAAAIMDDLMGATIFSLGKDVFYTSINLNVDYLYSVPVGNKVVAKSQVIRAGKKVVHIECEILDEHQNIIAKATSNLIATSKGLSQ
jgi:acyl-coenzyme A thioesterase 13